MDRRDILIIILIIIIIALVGILVYVDFFIHDIIPGIGEGGVGGDAIIPLDTSWS